MFYVTPELLKVKVPVICPFTECVRRPKETYCTRAALFAELEIAQYTNNSRST